MKANKTFPLLAVAALAAMTACSKEEAFDTSVTRELSMTLDGEPWNIYYGTTNKPLFIYHEDGSFLGNYSTSWRFALEEGSYRVFATNQSDYITPPTNINDQEIPQDTLCKNTFAISDPIVYEAGAPMNLELKTRTGMLRLKATDSKADKSYSILHAKVTTPVAAWHVGDAKVITSETPLELERYKETAGGGIGYTEEMYLIGSDAHEVNVEIEYLDADSTVVRSKKFDAPFKVLPNEMKEVTFNLNDDSEKVIVNYNVTIGKLDWKDQAIVPSVKVDVPDGYRYVTPDEDITAVFNEMAEDATVDEIKIFLKAATEYTIADKTLEGVTKPFRFLGQTPGYGQDKARLAVYNINMEGNIAELAFENLTLVPKKDRLFNLRNQVFDVARIEFKDVDIDGWNGSLWAQSSNADNAMKVGSIVMDGCRLTNLSPTSTLWNVVKNRIAPISEFTFRNTLFHGKNFGTRTVVLTGLTKIDTPITINVEGCTFIDSRGTKCTYFDIDCAASSNSTLNVRDCLVAGKTTGAGTWFKLGKLTTVNASGNKHAAGYEAESWGVDAPEADSRTFDEILSQFKL